MAIESKESSANEKRKMMIQKLYRKAMETTIDQ